MKKITITNAEVKATYEKGINDTNWVLRFYDRNGNAHTWDTGITTAAMLEALDRCREAAYGVTMATR